MPESMSASILDHSDKSPDYQVHLEYRNEQANEGKMSFNGNQYFVDKFNKVKRKFELCT